jgi:Ca-activated chloride channel family protein
MTVRMPCVRALVAVIGLAFITPAAAQVLFRARTDLVALNVTVLDDNGAPVGGLTRDAFTVTEDARPQPIEHFASDDVPISLVVALDSSDSMKGGRFEIARQAVKGFIDRLGANDEFAVFEFNDQPFNISLWSTSHEAILAALRRVEPQGYTALYAAVSAAVDGLRGSRNRRQALVIVSDGNHQLRGERPTAAGVNTAARQRALSAIERVQRSEAVVFAIGVDAPDVPPLYRLDAAALRSLTDSTGGSTRVVHSDGAMVEAAERIGDELRHQYVIGFVPAHPADGKFHSVQITVKGCACHVRARRGYVADKKTTQ